MADVTKDLEKRRKWLEDRRTGIGGSDAAVLLGLSPWSTPYTLYLDKIGATELQLEQNEPQLWGTKLEGLVADHYAEVTGRTLWAGTEMERSQERPHMLANTDRIIIKSDRVAEAGVYEGKTAAGWKAGEWADGKVPLIYQIQLQHYLYVLNMQWGSVAVLIGGQRFEYTDLDRDDRFLTAYLPKADEFWRRVQERDPPTPDGAPVERKAVAKLYQVAHPGEVVPLDGRLWDWISKWERAKKELAEARKTVDAYETLVKMAIGEAQYGRFPDGTGFKYAVEDLPERVLPPTQGRRVLRRVKRTP